MHIWVDADTCPGVIKDILFRAARRTGIALTLVANHPLKIPADANINFLQVASGFDVADNEIVHRIEVGDLVITGDIPLADEVLTKNALALNPRGEQYSKDSIKAKLNMRDFMETMRGSGIHTGGPPAINQTDRMAFANALDKLLAKSAL